LQLQLDFASQHQARCAAHVLCDPEDSEFLGLCLCCQEAALLHLVVLVVTPAMQALLLAQLWPEAAVCMNWINV